MMKESYMTPVMELCEFETEDVITTSGEMLINGGSSGVPETMPYTDLIQ